MKSVILMGLLAGVYTAQAQHYVRKTPEEKAMRYSKEMFNDLNLDSNQFAGIYAINLMVSQRFDSLYASKPAEDEKKQATIRILRNRDSLFRKVLRNDQFLHYDDLQRERWEKKKRERALQEQKGSE
ncbi:MAG TPA: hypothetical protein PLP34_08845 [Chitinophagaceae bacterium]|nr:hypothetical protein [Chitinophagaceae bacterium]HNF72509.1 hypothetical protein [Chitinophagaceae bacterium]